MGDCAKRLEEEAEELRVAFESAFWVEDKDYYAIKVFCKRQSTFKMDDCLYCFVDTPKKKAVLFDILWHALLKINRELDLSNDLLSYRRILGDSVKLEAFHLKNGSSWLYSTAQEEFMICVDGEMVTNLSDGIIIKEPLKIIKTKTYKMSLLEWNMFQNRNSRYVIMKEIVGLGFNNWYLFLDLMNQKVIGRFVF